LQCFIIRLAVEQALMIDRYVIANNTIEAPPNTPDINTNILEGIIPKLPVDIITIEQALAALKRSGPAVY
jgi:hypothetical protein